MTRHTVLILSSDALAAALVGAAVELAGHAPHFRMDRESSRAALMRVRPRVALVDCEDEDSCVESFLGPARMTGAGVLLLRSHRSRRNTTELAARMQLATLDMPVDHAVLGRAIDELLDERRET